MPDSFTANLGLIKPEVGASRDSWGTKTNENWDDVDQFVASAMPIGGLLDFAGPNAPPGWLICDGRLVSRVTYAALFAVIGTAWGAGDGSTTFALPGQQGRASIGPGTVIDASGNSFGFSFAQRGGYVQNSIAKVHLPNYAMLTDGQGSHGHGGATAIGGSHSHTTDAQGLHGHGNVTQGNNVDHTHTGSTAQAGEHTHGYQAMHAVGGPLAGGAAGSSAAYGRSVTEVTVEGPHSHAVTTGGATPVTHTHGIVSDGIHTHAISSSDNHTHGINTDGWHQHTVWLGGSLEPFTVQNPFIAVTKIIYAGRQALPVAAVAVVPQRRLSTPLRGRR